MMIASLSVLLGTVAAADMLTVFRRVTTTSTTTTTTTTLPAAPTWVSSMLAVWPLDEATGTRLNAQGTPSRNLSMIGAVTNDTTNKMEGTAAATMASTGMALTTSDPALVTPTPPFACALWVRPSSPTGYLLQSANFPAGYRLSLNSQTPTYQPFTSQALAAPATIPLNAFAHVAFVQSTASTCALYVNGLSVATSATCTYTPQSTNPFNLGSSGTDSNVPGQYDEALCAALNLSATAICRICSCGVRGEQCACSGTSYTSTGRNATACGACPLPSDCSLTTPPLGTTTTSTTTTTTLLSTVVIPTNLGADANCPTTIPVVNGTSANGWNGYASWGQTCATGANAHGYDVTAVAANISGATAGTKLKCSVYDAATPNAHVAAGCDTSEATLVANPGAYVSMATTGACHLAAGTRYWIACAVSDAATTYGQNTTGCVGCWKYASGQTYATLWPATLTNTGGYGITVALYLTATVTP
jgi:hypothetical protein